MTALLQISDTHFGTEAASRKGLAANWRKMRRPDLVKLSGDITQRARGGRFRAARQFADQLRPAALLAIPGKDHDMPLFNIAARVFSPYGNYSRPSSRILNRSSRPAICW